MIVSDIDLFGFHQSDLTVGGNESRVDMPAIQLDGGRAFRQFGNHA